MGDLTLEDIARLANVSRATVSRVINNQPNVREDVRKRVMKVVDETGFQPNSAARSLVSARSWMIGLVIPRTVISFFSDPYFPRLLQGVTQACNQHGYTLGLFTITDRDDEVKIFPRISRKGILDGIIVQSGDMGDTLIERLEHSSLPLIIAGRPHITEGVNFIDVDNIQGAYQAVAYLVSLGHRRIGQISGPLSSTVGIDRQKGYQKALEELGLPGDANLIAEGDFTESGGWDAMRRILPWKPDAVFAASDAMAYGAVRAIQESGLRVPEDISIIGYDDLPIATMAHPQLTTIQQPIVPFGVQAVEILLDLIENGPSKEPKQVFLETQLIVRSTCSEKRR